MSTSDDELRDRLGAGDPARDLPHEDPARAHALLQDVMATELTTENRATGTRHRSRLTWLVAAAAVLVIAGAALFGVRALTGDDPGAPVAGPASPTVTHLTVADPGAGRCMMPTAEAIATSDLAFDGTVTKVDGDQVTLEPRHWYAGEPTDQVVVTAPAEELQRLASAVSLSRGDRYLISAVDGRVTVCGRSGAYDDHLAALYQQAFG
jgi:hypothetical protein